MHLKRLLIAIVALPLIYFYITKLSAGYFLLLIMIVSFIAQHEFYSMYKVNRLLKYMGIAFGILTILAFSPQSRLVGTALNLKPFDLLAVLFFIIASVRLFIKRNPAYSLHEIGAIVTTVIYIPFLLGYQIYLREHGVGWIILLYGSVWASDSMAYYAGKNMGRRKLYEEISPNKTIAGAVGSIAGGALGAVALKALFTSAISMPFAKAVILGTIIGAVTIIGDLVESMFKRDAGIKDSSHIIPGHGGLLDKIDSMLFAGPVLYWAAIGFGLIK